MKKVLRLAKKKKDGSGGGGGDGAGGSAAGVAAVDLPGSPGKRSRRNSVLSAILHPLGGSKSDGGTKARISALLQNVHADNFTDIRRPQVHAAVLSGDVERLKRLVSKNTTEVVELLNSVDSLGRTPLHLAAEKGLVSHVWPLISHGASVQVRDARGATPLHM